MERLLAVDRDVVAEAFKRLAREGVVFALDLLEADNVRLSFR
jgi:hypothetical protein